MTEDRAAGTTAGAPDVSSPTAGEPDVSSPVAGEPDVRSPAAGASTVALPVCLQLGGRHSDAVRRWIEGVLGWQPVDAATAGLVPPAVALRDLVPVVAETTARVPCVLLVDDDAVPLEVARASLGLGADDVLGWPSGRDRLAEVVGGVLARPRELTGDVRVLRVGGSAGGVGTSTVTLALAGLSGWAGAPTIAAVRGAGSRLRAVPSAAFSGPDLWAQADELPGLGATRAVRLVDPDPVPDPTDLRIEVAIVDLGVARDVDILVCRPDAAALEALPATTAAAVVITGDGPVPEVELRRAAHGRRVVALPWSVRVARAGLAGRVPAGLPGAWLRRLRPLVPVPATPPAAGRPPSEGATDR
jgi:hypothetical protein